MTMDSIENWRTGRPRRRILVARVDPAVVRDNYVKRTPLERIRFYGASLGLPWYRRRGGWDLRCRPFREHPTFLFLQEFQRCGFEPSATERFHEMCRRERPKQGPGAGDTEPPPQGVMEYFDHRRALFESMQRSGYRAGLAVDEIGFVVARDGRLIKTANGNNRMAVAQLLGLESVTMELRYVHERWYRRCANGPRSGFRERIAEQTRGIPGVLEVSID